MAGTVRSRLSLTTVLVLMAVAVAGCSKNPVTREREFVPFSTGQEIETGRKYYRPTQQAQGGQYKADPALNEYVKRVGRKVAKVSDRRLPYEFVVLNNGTANAWALPGGKIAINRGLLLEMENEAELAAVLAHEVVHAAARHGAQAMTRNLVFQVAQAGVALAAGQSQYSRYTNYILGASGVGLQLIGRRYGRDAEREADVHGMRYMKAAGYDTRAAVTLQEKFLALSKGRKPNWLKGLFATHPPSAERVKNNRAALARFPAGGKVGREPYDKALASLRAKQPAYEAADRARGEMAKAPESALGRVDKAIAQEPREALFHGLKGQIQARRSQFTKAVAAYDAAIERDGAYYEHFLGRGLAYDALGRRVEARRDLERSMQLLPTALASHALGHIVLAEGDRARAKTLFGNAANVRGEIGEAARRSLVMLDIADAPDRYVKTQPFLRSGQVLVELTNQTSIPLTDVTIHVEARSGGRTLPRRLSPTRLAARGKAVLASGIWYRGTDRINVDVRVLRARPAAAKAGNARPYRAYP